RVAAIPQRQPQAQPLLDIAETGQAILAPPVGTGPCRIVRQVIPRIAARAAILPDRAPLPLAHIRSPQVPVTGLPQPVLQPPEPVYPIPFSTHRRFPVASMYRNFRLDVPQRPAVVPASRSGMILRGEIHSRPLLLFYTAGPDQHNHPSRVVITAPPTSTLRERARHFWIEHCHGPGSGVSHWHGERLAN